MYTRLTQEVLSGSKSLGWGRAAGVGLNVLVVDDDVEIRVILRDTLAY